MKRWLNILGILGLFVAGSIGGQLGLEAARAAFWQWSTTPINNQTADPSINWSEGMSPSSVNDSARAMMARLAEQGKDTSGQLTTTGGPTTYSVTSNQGFPNPPQDGQVIGLSFNVTNNINPTLSVDGGANEPILIQPGTGVPAGTLVAGVPYTMKFNGATTSWLLRDVGGGGLANVPIGTILPYSIAGNPADTNYVVAAGECISTTTYATYWALLGSPAPGACGAGTFAVLDLRGRVLAGTDIMGGSGAAGRLTSAAGGCGVATTNIGTVCTNGLESHTMALGELVTHSHGAPMYDPQHYHVIPLGDPGHFHATSTSDPQHYHAAAMADPSHTHNFIQNGSATSTVYTNISAQYQYLQGGPQGAQQYGTTIQYSGTGVYISGVAGGYTSNAATGVTMTSGNGGNTTGSKATGITMAGAGGNYSTNNATTGVRVNGVSLDNTANTGSSTPFPVVQPTIVVNYIIRVL